MPAATEPMDWQLWYTLGVLAAMIYGLVRDALAPDIVLFGALVLLLAGGVLTPDEAIAGFSNQQMLTIGALFVLAAAVRETGGLAFLTQRLLRSDLAPRRGLLRVVLPTVSLSAFLNNTPIVAMLTPAVHDWARRVGHAPSKLLIPLSYAAILGGTCTLIGTSTNLMVSGLLVQHGAAPLGLFELSPVGLIVAGVGILYLVFVAQRLLPNRPDPYKVMGDQRKEYLVELEVRDDCPLAGRTVESAGLRHLPGLFLMQIFRDDQSMLPVRPDNQIRVGDRLVFTGVASTVVDLQKIRGLVPSTAAERASGEEDRDGGRLYEAVISPSSPLVGVSVRDAGFRRHYNAVVVAVHRSGERIKSKIGDIVLRQGDVLMLEAPGDFASSWQDSTDFYLISSVRESRKVRHEHSFAVLSILGAMIVLVALRVVPLLVGAFCAVVLVIGLRTISSGVARRSVDWSVLLVIACALGISKAVEKTGLADLVATAVIDLLQHWGAVAVLAAIYFLTNLFTELITNTAAAALMFPIALQAAGSLDADPRAFAIVVALAASASFSTPLGYQTNLIVYGPGGYRFTDFLRVGAPLNAISGAVVVSAVVWLWEV